MNILTHVFNWFKRSSKSQFHSIFIGSIKGYLVQVGQYCLVIAVPIKNKRIVNKVNKMKLMHRYDNGYCIVQIPIKNYIDCNKEVKLY